MLFHFPHIAYTEVQLKRAKEYLLATRKDFRWFAMKGWPTQPTTKEESEKNADKSGG